MLTYRKELQRKYKHVLENYHMCKFFPVFNMVMPKHKEWDE